MKRLITGFIMGTAILATIACGSAVKEVEQNEQVATTTTKTFSNVSDAFNSALSDGDYQTAWDVAYEYDGSFYFHACISGRFGNVFVPQCYDNIEERVAEKVEHEKHQYCYSVKSQTEAECFDWWEKLYGKTFRDKETASNLEFIRDVESGFSQPRKPVTRQD